MQTMAWTDERLEERFNAIDKRFDAIDVRFELVDKQFELVDKRFEAIDRRLDRVDMQLVTLQAGINRVWITIVVGLFGVIAAIVTTG